MMSDLLPCPLCGGNLDPDYKRIKICMGCHTVFECSDEVWNKYPRSAEYIKKKIENELNEIKTCVERGYQAKWILKAIDRIEYVLENVK